MLNTSDVIRWLSDSSVSISDDGWRIKLELANGEIGYCRISDFEDAQKYLEN